MYGRTLSFTPLRALRKADASRIMNCAWRQLVSTYKSNGTTSGFTIGSPFGILFFALNPPTVQAVDSRSLKLSLHELRLAPARVHLSLAARYLEKKTR